MISYLLFVYEISLFFNKKFEDDSQLVLCKMLVNQVENKITIC